jgi:chemotaxis protein CheY-P-specific phosphatase CheC
MNTNNERENFLVHVMSKGFERAATSFSQLINRPVKIINSQSILIKNEEAVSYISEESGDLSVLVTQIIGDITGKSYLIFNQDESKEIFRALKTSVINESLNEAFLMEIDNIISASVISELSNSIELEIYGDVPKLTKIHSSDLHAFMNKDGVANDHSSVIFCNTTFQFDEHDRVHPQFIWRLSNKIFEMIPEHREAVKI